ncbi:hypothetical protein HNQ07_004505 [Deinococcus metalli]|uniref:Uncharacterized protein n=1 Tax=Deinococcus metalli TaxID=1141878 RepID=A0A7W8NSI7_9DEIO|nr:DEAD/DEAH box helicase family protein [Deinococcus metalli]MBB5378995.1 hypothetical protein [Deinococcus metalli]GHF63499.1 hypothetical protein GCM10017781_44310 [Deinococcus metalli]
MSGIQKQVTQVVMEAMAAGPGVTVIRAAPGSGKTAGAVRAIVERLQDPPARIVWAVRETVAIRKGPTEKRKRPAGQSLASQTVAALNQAAGHECAQIILGQQHLSEKAYLAQFRWPLPVAVVSHAHLPLILQSGLEGSITQLRAAQAIIVDEDPLGALTLHGGLQPGGLRSLPLRRVVGILDAVTATAADRAAVARLARIEFGWSAADVSLAHQVQEFGVFPPGQSPTESGLRGAGFWQAAAPALALLKTSCAARNQLEDALAVHLRPGSANDPLGAGARQAVADFVVRELLADLVAWEAGTVTTRYGLVWKGGAAATYGKSLAWDLLQRVHVDRPVIVLDAYADEAQYRAVFGDMVQIVDVGHRPPLHVELAPGLALEPARLESRKARLVAQEVQAHAARSPQGQLLLVPKDVVPSVKGLLAEAATLAGAPAADVAVTHWYSGRGVNHFHGRDVRALTLPHLPLSHEVCTLSALYPLAAQAPERRALHRHHERAELLQLLHRGRQGQHPPGAAPRAILHGLPCALCPRAARTACRVQAEVHPQPCTQWDGGITVSPYHAAVPVKALSRNPTARATLAAVARDLHLLCGGVPLLALQAIGLVPSQAGLDPAQLYRATQILLRHATRKDLQTLAAWRARWLAQSGPHERRRLQVWPGTSQLRDNSHRLVEEVLCAAPWAWQRWRIARPPRRSPHVVWAVDETQADRALTVVAP